MSSCDASCSICCDLGSYASATSASSPIATALLCCPCALDCSADQRKRQRRKHLRPQIRLTHSGTALSAAEPGASSNGSPPPNSCFALHLYRTRTQHEDLSTPSAFARASARTKIPCLIRQKPLACQPLQHPHQASTRHCPAPFGLQANQSRPTQPVPDPAAPAKTDSKRIAFHEGGFLQVAVSEAPRLGAGRCARLRGGALQIQH